MDSTDEQIEQIDRLMDDEIALFEERGMNYALWLWESSWEPYPSGVDAFNFQQGCGHCRMSEEVIL